MSYQFYFLPDDPIDRITTLEELLREAKTDLEVQKNTLQHQAQQNHEYEYMRVPELFEPYHQIKPTARSIMNKVTSYVQGTFASDTIQTKDIYLCTHKNCLKLGYAKNAVLRLREWNRTHADPFEHAMRPIRLPTARVVEGLVLRMMARDRKKLPCTECKRGRLIWHIEYLDAPVDEVKELINAWDLDGGRLLMEGCTH